MSPQEWFWELDAKIKTSREMKSRADGKPDVDWGALRKRHREKMKARAND